VKISSATPIILAVLTLTALAGRSPANGVRDADARPARPAEKIKLQLGGRPGETYVTEYTLTSKVAPLDESVEVTAQTAKTEIVSLWIETAIKEVRPQGRIVITQRVKRIASSVTRGGETTTLDSDDDATREAAKQDERLAPLLKLLDGAVEEELEPTGEVHKFTIIGTDDPAVRALFEDEISHPIALLPDRPVDMLDKWDCGFQAKSFPGLGHGNVKLEGVLLDVHGEGDDRMAEIGIRGEMAWESDPDTKAAVELQEFKWGGLESFSIAKGRYVAGFRSVEGTLKCTDQNGSVRLKVTDEIRIQEAR